MIHQGNFSIVRQDDCLTVIDTEEKSGWQKKTGKLPEKIICKHKYKCDVVFTSASVDVAVSPTKTLSEFHISYGANCSHVI